MRHALFAWLELPVYAARCGRVALAAQVRSASFQELEHPEIWHKGLLRQMLETNFGCKAKGHSRMSVKSLLVRVEDA